MSSSVFFPYLALLAVIMRALAIKAQIGTPSCGHCGRPLERRQLGERVCHCSVG